jgi:hypothetical protein
VPPLSPSPSLPASAAPHPAAQTCASLLLAAAASSVDIQSTDNSWQFSNAAATHYGDPFQGACETKEVNITITGVAGSVCSPPCGLGGKCPTDIPAGATAKPTCALTDTAGKKYCVLVCAPSGIIADQQAADAQCGTDASCKAISGTGICTYDDGAPTPAPTPPPPAPPTPPPAPTPAGQIPKIALQYTAQVLSTG